MKKHVYRQIQSEDKQMEKVNTFERHFYTPFHLQSCFMMFTERTAVTRLLKLI